MSGRWLHYLWLAYLSKPKGERLLFRLIKKHPTRSIVEIGVGNLERALRVVDFARQCVPNGELTYTGIDLFEGRPDPTTGISFKEAHGLLKQVDAKTKLIPGDPFSALARSANGLAGTDLVLIASDVDSTQMQQAWAFLPRMLHDETLVIEERRIEGEEGEPDEHEYVLLTSHEIRERAGDKAQHIAKAA